MLMLILSILATIVTIILTVLIVFANGMSDSPSTPFQGKWFIFGCIGVTVALWFAWWFG